VSGVAPATLAPRPPIPGSRRLQIYAFDPSLAIDNATAAFATATLSVPWREPFDAPLTAGPVNEYLEVVDIDPESGKYYQPVDLDDPYLLATDGYPPSESNPQFHQQMAFAVASYTIGTFEKALGRRVLWSASPVDHSYVQQLRIYPHALRARNAYYSPAKKALLFGYYPEPNAKDVYTVKDMWVFGCLSHDIVAHETSHAILDGINSRLIEDFAPDSLAFHEGLADIVALLQHFTFPDAVRSEIGRHVGTLDSPTLLSGLALQFGLASQRTDGLPNGPLRDAVVKNRDQPDDLANFTEAHQRGARLLSAVYAAFIEIYRREADQILQIAVPVAPGMPLDPRVVDRLSNTAVEAACHLLTMCIRALDYLPPSTVDFGDYLRAIVTADFDLDPVDAAGYRRAVIGAFRRFGVVPVDVRSLAEDSLWWDVSPPRGTPGPTGAALAPRRGELKLDLDPLFERRAIFEQSKHNALVIHQLLMADPALCVQLGLRMEASDRVTGAPKLSMSWVANGTSPFEVHSVRMARRVRGDRQLRQLFITITQWRRGYLDEAVQADVDSGAIPPPEPDFKVRGGATLIIDLRTYRSARAPKYDKSTTRRTSIFALPRIVIQQPADDDARLAAMRSHRMAVEDAALRLAYAAPTAAGTEPLAVLHAARGTAYAA